MLSSSNAFTTIQTPRSTSSVHPTKISLLPRTVREKQQERTSIMRRHMTTFDPQLLTQASDMITSGNNIVETMNPNLLAFADQGQNLAGIFFQASLLPYLIFLYFLSFRGNRVPALGKFGFQFLLVFVISTIPSGIISKATYGCSLADVDWLHGGAEALLTVTNILIVLGFQNAMKSATTDEEDSKTSPIDQLLQGSALYTRGLAAGVAALFAAACALGPSIGFPAHGGFLLGLGNLPNDLVASLPWVVHSEPVNALSIPTWAIHFSSVFEFIFAMNVIWNFSEATGNEKWKGLTWGMLPAHASGVAACTYHFFYRQWVVTTQAGLTCLGNITLAIAAWRIALSNGWTWQELNPLPKSNTSPRGIIVEQNAAVPLQTTSVTALELTNSNAEFFTKLAVLTFAAAYVVKYGELGLDVPFTASPIAAASIIAGIPALVAFNFYNKSQLEKGESGITLPKLPSFGGEDGPSLSMDDVKKYGVSGTVAYVLTELAFWAVAFPVASTALYQSTGHWPDVINDPTDRTTVLGFIFAGANVARLLVPVRLGAALALAPWVDENILNRDGEATLGSGRDSGKITSK